LFIAHDLKVACYFCDRIGVMYKGELMEEAPAANLYKEGLHPYTKLLFSSASKIDDRDVPATATVTKDPVMAKSITVGCPFAPRCIQASERCFREHPELTQAGEGHLIRCFNCK